MTALASPEGSPSSQRQSIGEARCISSATGTIEYFSSGSGPAVLLLPALARSVQEFAPLVVQLNAAGFRTLAVQFPGIGRSRRRFRPRATLWDFADDLTQVLNDAGVPSGERVHLVGRGLGNRVARAFASRHADRTASVILLAAGGKHRGWPRLSVMLKYLFLQVPALPLSIRRSIMESILCARRHVLPDDVCDRPPLRAVLQQSGAARRTDSRDWWSAGRSPMLVIQGEADRVAPPAYANDLAREFPDRVKLRMIPNAGHALLFDQPEAVIEHVLRFLRERSVTGS